MENCNLLNVHTIDGITVRVCNIFGNIPLEEILFNIITVQLKEQEKEAA